VSSANHQPPSGGTTRREFIAQVGTAGLGVALSPLIDPSNDGSPEDPVSQAGWVTISMVINGRRRTLTIDPRSTLLDILRERLLKNGRVKIRALFARLGAILHSEAFRKWIELVADGDDHG